MDRRFLGILAALVIIFIGIFAVTQNSSNKNNSGNSQNTAKNQPTEHKTGKSPKGVTLIEYGDYQCPICYVYYPTAKQVAEKYQNDIVFQFRNLPLFQVHKNAFAAARAAEAASLQGKFWQMHDMLYVEQDPNGQTGWVASPNPLTYFTSFAQQIGLNADQFKRDYASDQVNSSINADVAAFDKTGQQHATPTFFIDGKYIDNAQLADNNGPSVDKFSKVIEAEIAQKQANNQ